MTHPLTQEIRTTLKDSGLHVDDLAPVLEGIVLAMMDAGNLKAITDEHLKAFGHDSRGRPYSGSAWVDTYGREWIVVKGSGAQYAVEYYGGWSYVDDKDTRVMGEYKFYSGSRVNGVIETLAEYGFEF